METFFRKLKYVEKAYNYETTYYDEEQNPIRYSDTSQNILKKLIKFVESGEFTNKRASKFICKHWRASNKELQSLWEEEFGKLKSDGAFRAQLSTTSHVLYVLFGDDFAYDFMDDNVGYIGEIIDAYRLGSFTFNSAFGENVGKFVKESKSEKEYEIEELNEEIRVLRKYTKVNLEKEIDKLDKDKLTYIKAIMDEPLTIRDTINVKKFELLKGFKLVDNIKGFCKPSMSLKYTMSQEQMTALKEVMTLNKEKESNNRDKIEELKEVMFSLYTKEGIKAYFSQFSTEEINQALQEVNSGIVNN